MSSPSSRSVKISSDERGGWSSDRPRREGSGPPRPADVSVRSRVLGPSDRMRYAPGSLLLIVGADEPERERFVQRVLEDQKALLSVARVRGLLTGKVADDEMEERAGQILDAAVAKRMGAGESVVLATGVIDAEERERYVRMASPLRRPRHLILLETGRDQVPEEDRPALNELRRALDAGELGSEGFHTALRLGGGAIAELKRIVFRSAPPED